MVRVVSTLVRRTGVQIDGRKRAFQPLRELQWHGVRPFVAGEAQQNPIERVPPMPMVSPSNAVMALSPLALALGALAPVHEANDVAPEFIEILL